MRFLSILVSLVFASIGWAQNNTWYVHSGNSSGGRNGSAGAPYNSITEWHQAVNGAGSSTTGIVGNCTLVLASSEGNFFRDGPWTLNFGTDATKSLTVRPWSSDTTIDPAPGGSLPIQRPVLRGDVLLTSLTDNDGGSPNVDYYSEQLPVAVTAVHQILFKYDDSTRFTKEGFRTGHINVVNTTGDPSLPMAAGTAHYNSNTRRIWIGTSGLSTTAGDFAYCASGYSTSGKSNALLCFQNSFNCTIDGLEGMAIYEGTQGWYAFSMENATNGTIKNCRTVGTSHHGVGFSGTSAPGNVNCLIENCEIQGLGGTNGSLLLNRGGAGFFMGNSAGNVNCVARNNTVHLHGHLGPTGTPIYTNTLGAVWLGSTSGGTSSGFLVENCRFINYPAYVSTTSLPTATTCWTTTTPTNVNDANSYPAIVRNCEFINMTGCVIAGNTGASQSLAYVNCVLDFSGFSNLTAGTSNNGVFNYTIGGSNTNAFLFKKCIISANLHGLGGSVYPTFFTAGSGTNDGTRRVTFTFDDSVVSWTGGKMGPVALYCGFFEFRSGAAGLAGMKVVARNSIFTNPWAMQRDSTAAGLYGDRYMLAGLNPAGTAANNDFTFTNCGLYNFRDGFYTDGTVYDDYSEWSTLVDTTSTKFTMSPVVGLPFQARLNPALPASVQARFSGLPVSPGVQRPTDPVLRGRGR